MTEGLSSGPIAIRPAADGDVAAIRDIYAYHVLHGLASFEIEPPSVEEIARRRAHLIAGGYPYFVAERVGDIVGYAYAGPYRTRPGYRYTAENSVYVRQDSVGRGVGRLLLDALIPACEQRGLRQLVAIIGDSANHASIELHRRAGFAMIGTIRSAGFKSGRWVDTVLMQRALGPGDSTRPEDR